MPINLQQFPQKTIQTKLGLVDLFEFTKRVEGSNGPLGFRSVIRTSQLTGKGVAGLDTYGPLNLQALRSSYDCCNFEGVEHHTRHLLFSAMSYVIDVADEFGELVGICPGQHKDRLEGVLNNYRQYSRSVPEAGEFFNYALAEQRKANLDMLAIVDVGVKHPRPFVFLQNIPESAMKSYAGRVI